MRTSVGGTDACLDGTDARLGGTDACFSEMATRLPLTRARRQKRYSRPPPRIQRFTWYVPPFT
jgi:hypothetical protein